MTLTEENAEVKYKLQGFIVSHNLAIFSYLPFSHIYKVHHGTTTSSGHCKKQQNIIGYKTMDYDFADTAYIISNDGTLVHYNDNTVCPISLDVIDTPYVRVCGCNST